MDTVYIETSVISYLRQRPSSQVVMAAHQLLTRKWWDTERTNYELVVSQYVLDEASGGDATLAAERLQLLKGIPLLPDALCSGDWFSRSATISSPGLKRLGGDFRGGASAVSDN
jgi:hypothetical protein